MSKTKIVYAVEMLHYLPLYLAQTRLSDDFEIELAPAPHGDRAAIGRLMSTLSSDREVNFCVCDPMMVNLSEAYSASTGDWPVVIGQLIQKVPFWAVNHERANFSDEDKFADYDQIFAYPKPNTGYVFGKLIHDRCRRIKGKDFKDLREKPIDADLDLFLTSDGTVVIEADILKIRKYQETTRHEVVFSYPLHPKYNRFCFTALITRRRFLETSDGLLKARLLIRALQSATFLIYAEHDLAFHHAQDRFSLKGFDPATVDGALRQLASQEVFSRSLVVDYRGWQKSVYVQQQVESQFRYPSYRKFINNRIAREEYRDFLKAQTKSSSFFLVRNVADYPLVVQGLQSLMALALLLYPLLILAFKHELASALTGEAQPWLIAHLVLTVLTLTVFYFSGRLTAFFNLDPANWLAHSFVIVVGYAIADLTIMVELLRH